MGKEEFIQLVKIHLAAFIEFGIVFGNISFKKGRLFFFNPLEPFHECGLVSCKMRDILKGTPFTGIRPDPQLLLGHALCHLDDGFMLVF